MAKDAKGHGSETRTATGAPWDYGKTIGFGSRSVPSNPHPDSPMGRAAVKSGQGVQLQLGLGHPKATPVPVHAGASGRNDYNPHAVNNAIASSNRAGRRIGGREASAIHRLLKGRG